MESGPRKHSQNETMLYDEMRALINPKSDFKTVAKNKFDQPHPLYLSGPNSRGRSPNAQTPHAAQTPQS